MKRLRFIFLAINLAALALCSCSKVHQFPEEGREVDPTDIGTRIDVSFKVELEGYDIITKAGLLDEQAADYDRRFVVSIFTNEYDAQLVESHVVTRSVEDVSDLIIETKLHTRKYKVVVWMDYVKKGTDTDLYYLCSNGTALNAIHQPSADKYTAGSDFKDAQTFMSEIDLTTYAGQWYGSITIPAPLSRPIAKITLLANDLAKFADQIGYTGTLEELADQITLDFSYDGYYPTGFNAVTGRLNDSQTGYGFKSLASYPYTLEEQDYSRLGFDYVFVNGETSSVTLSVRIRFKDGRLINEVGNVVVPITRGRETVIIFKFFTKDYVPGIGIDPGFDGEYDVYV